MMRRSVKWQIHGYAFHESNGALMNPLIFIRTGIMAAKTAFHEKEIPYSQNKF
jgi:hypothetical protein